MLKRSLFLLLAILITLSPFTSIIEVHAADGGSGTTYYVSTLNGNNNNNGKSEGKAFYNLQKINEIELQPGDRVLLEADSVFMDGYLHVQGSGAEGAPIVIDRYGEGDDPEIRTNGQGIWYQDYGSVLDSPSHKNKGYVSSSILLYDVEYIEINNLNISNDADMYNEYYSDVDKMNRTGVAAVAQNKGTINHIYLNNLNIHDIRGNVYDKHMNNGGIYFTVFKPENESETGISRYNDIIIENSIVNDVSRWGIAVGYTAYWKPFAGIGEIPDEIVEKYGSSNVIIRNNYIKDAGGDAITAMYLDRPLIENNVSEGAAKEINPEVYSETAVGRVAAGIWPWKSKNAVLQYNEVFDTHLNQDGQAWDADYGDGTLYQYNYSHNNGGGALMVCCGGAEVVNTVFRYNISQNDLSGVLNLPTNPMVEVYNNTFYIAEGVDFIRDGMTGGTADIENNIIYNAGEKKEEDWIKNSNVTYSNNIYYNYENTPESDGFAITDDPQLVNPGTGPTALKENADAGSKFAHDRDAFNGYALKDTSPAINKGKHIANNGGKDFFGNEVTGTPDIGAYESNAVSLEIYSDIYTIDGTDIKGVEKDTTVAVFMDAFIYDKDLSLEVLDQSGNQMDDNDIVTPGFQVKLSHDTSERTYTVVASDNNEILDAIYIVDEESQAIFVPMLENNPTDVDEVKSGINVHSTATVKVFDGANEVTTGNITDGMQLKIIAENDEEKTYTLATKNEYQYALDFVNGQQGNVWYAQKKVDGEYTNLTSFNTVYPTWDGKNYATVGLQGNIDDVVTEQTHGLLSDTMNKASDSKEQAHAMAYRVPKTGTIKLTFKDDEPFLRQAPNANGDVILSFTLNGELIGESYVLPNDGTPARIDLIELEVKQGDYLRIEIANEGSPTKPSAYITPLITYQDAVELDTIGLETLIEEVSAITNDDGKYTAESFAALEAALEAAESALAEAESQAVIDEALASLNSALEDLVEVEEPEVPVLDTEKLEALITTVSAISNDDGKYTAESFAALEAALEAAESALAEAESQAAIDKALASLNSALEDLVEVEEPEVPVLDTEKLEALITTVSAISNETDKYTAESFAALKAALEAAEKVLTEAESQAAIDEALASLNSALEDLVEVEEPEVPVLDTEKLEALIAKVSDISNETDKYTAESFADLVAALEAAEKALVEAESQAVIDVALATLNSALEDLVEVEEPEVPVLDKGKLEALIAKVSDISNETDKYTAESFADLVAALEAAEKALVEAESQAVIDVALATLNSALEDLVEVEEPEVPVLDTEKLEALIAKVSDISNDANKYTTDSFAAFVAALEAAEKALAEAESQDDIDVAVAALTAAMEGLELIKPVDPVDPVDPTDPVEPSNPETEENNQVVDGDNELPKTATTMYNWLLYGLLTLVLGVVGLVIYRRRVQN